MLASLKTKFFDAFGHAFEVPDEVSPERYRSLRRIMTWLMVAVQKKGKEARAIPKRELLFICLSGVATGASWLCYYRALQDGPASIVAPVDKLSVLVTVAFSRLVFGEKLGRRAAVGLLLLTLGTVAMALL